MLTNFSILLTCLQCYSVNAWVQPHRSNILRVRTSTRQYAKDDKNLQKLNLDNVFLHSSIRNYQHNKIATPELTSYHYGKSYVEQEHRSKISPICHYKLLLLTILPALQRSLQTKSFSVLPNLL